MPVVSSMEVRQIGQLGTADDPGPAVYLSETALAADGLIVCNRVKPHTDFRGELESGLAKITAIGLGKHQGAKTIHSFGTRGLAHWLPQAARLIVQTAPVLGGLAVLENAYDQTARVVAVPPGRRSAGAAEAALLAEARGLMASLPFDDIDVLVVDEMGKNVSGTGMDTNIIGRMMIRGVTEFRRPDVRIVVVLDLTEELHGNGAGIGLADVLTLRAARKLDLRATYINGLTSGIGGVQRVKLPMFLPSDVDAICAGVLCCGQGDPQRAGWCGSRTPWRSASWRSPSCSCPPSAPTPAWRWWGSRQRAPGLRRRRHLERPPSAGACGRRAGGEASLGRAPAPRPAR